MKKVIEGRRYDTSKAVKIASWESGEGDNYIREALYRKKRTHDFFLHCTGGAASRYSQAAGPGVWQPGECITPIPDDTAREWLKAHAPAEYDRMYSKQDKHAEKHQAGFLLTDDTHNKLSEFARARRWSMSEALEYIINNYIDNH